MFKSVYKGLSIEQLSNLHEITNELIDTLPGKALEELLGGDEKDLGDLFDDVLRAAEEVVYNDQYRLADFRSLDSFSSHFDETMKIRSYNYFKTTCLPNFNQGWRNLEWGNMVQLYPWSAYLAARGNGKSYEFCHAFPLWRLYRYKRPHPLFPDTLDNKNSKDTVIITNESTLGKEHLSKIIEEILANDILRERFGDQKEATYAIEKLLVKSGARIILRSKESKSIRGLHVGGVIVDDFLDKSVIFSKEQRDKAWKEKFQAEIIPIVEPGGTLIISGTPFHEDDMYAKLKQDPRFQVFEYPAIYKDGTLLAPDRFSFSELMNLKKSQGTLVFSREYLITPISDQASIFPWDYLNRSFIGMENISFVDNLDSFPIKLNRIVLGCDFAKSGSVGADFSAFTVWGIDSNENYYLLHLDRGKGWSHNEQVSRIVRLDSQFKPNVIVCEDNGFQSILLELIRERGLRNVEGFTTTGFNKKDLYEGLPSLAALFERGQIRIPYREGKDREMAMLICGEFNSIGFDEDHGKLESISEHDDIVMSSFIAIYNLRNKKSGFKISYVEI